MRRTYGSGTIHRRSTGLWVFSILKDGTRTAVTSQRFCMLLRKLKERELLITSPPPMSRHTMKIRLARTLATHTTREWDVYVEASDRICEYCGLRCSPTQDHRTPLARGGSDGLANLAVACLTCNTRKGDKTEPEYRAWLLAHPEELIPRHVKEARVVRLRDLAAIYERMGLTFTESLRRANLEIGA